MTDKTKQLEKEFNKDLPKVRQGEIGAGNTKFNKELFLKSAQELQEIIEANDREHTPKPITGSEDPRQNDLP